MSHVDDDLMANGNTDDAVRRAVHKLRLVPILWAAAGIMLASGLIVQSLVSLSLSRELHDAREDIEVNRVENSCRADIAARLEVIDSEINYNGWQGLTAFYVLNDRQEALRRAQIITDLNVERSEASDDRGAIIELCDKQPPPEE